MAKLALNPKQRLFVQEYLIDKNATRAAIAAGYSKKTARQMGAENLSKPDIQKAIKSGLAEQADKADVTADRVIARIAEIAFDDDNKPMEILKACELLGKRFKLFTDVVETNGNHGGAQVILYLPRNGSEAPELDEEDTKAIASGRPTIVLPSNGRESLNHTKKKFY